MSDLLKEAIADAKAVRETALLNAKAALEEAFTPQLKSMLSAKLKEDEGEVDFDVDDEEEVEGEDDGEAEEGMLGTLAGAGLGAAVGGGPVGAGLGGVAGDAITGEDEMEPEDGEMEAEETYEDEEVEESNLDLEAIIKELEQEIAEGEDDELADDEEEVSEGEESDEDEYEIDENALSEDEDEEEDDEELDEEVDTTSGIGSGTGRGSTDKTSGIGSGGQEKSQKMESVQAELDEYKEAVTYLKDKLHEVNILNAKLLYTNKLFKEYSLDNNQKLKVVETFDRAQTTREIKLVYSTIAEQLNENTGIIKRKSIKESASTKVGSTKPSKESQKVISEESEVADRFKKLAGIIKG